MGLERAIEKLDKYYKRLNNGKARKIKPAHVEKVIEKLEARADALKAELSETEKESKASRLNRKLDLVREQQDRARWLKEKIVHA